MDTILIVDDNPAICDALSLLLDLHGYQTISCHQPAQAISIVGYQNISLVIQDMNFKRDTTSGEEGQELFYQLRRLQPDLPIILITAWTQLAMAVSLVKDGAADYLCKPWDDAKLLVSITNLLELSELRVQNQRLQRQQAERNELVADLDLCGLIYASTAMQQLLEMAKQVAVADISVLITGPNGAGKEKIAQIIQANSLRKEQPFIKVNIGAMPIDLMEAELFGAEVGAYTGLTKKRIGRFEAADGGTLFLDEIGELPLSGQVKLLRVLQTGEFERLGSHQTRKVNVRVVSATNANLAEHISQGKFREDLFYRLNVIELNLVPLTQRPDDIMPLVGHFLSQEAFGQETSSKANEISNELESVLLAHPWPGNVRELENACKRAKLLSAGKALTAQHFGLQSLKIKPTDLYEPNQQEIQQALLEFQGVISKVARHLGLSRQALYRRMAKYGIKH
ncbi:MAG: sigma-54-dependent Fis family transcriptional regulator [Alteromonadaceae bacterium]|nr:sigma-54-dependent Fis family transcriptional regulator [Alteromonadaceae bacterium]